MDDTKIAEAVSRLKEVRETLDAELSNKPDDWASEQWLLDAIDHIGGALFDLGVAD